MIQLVKLNVRHAMLQNTEKKKMYLSQQGNANVWNDFMMITQMKLAKHVFTRKNLKKYK